MRALGNLGYTLLCWAQPEPATRYLRQALAYAQRHEVHNLAPYVATNLAWLRLRAGEWDEAERFVRAEAERGPSVVQLVGKIVLTELAVRRGDSDAYELLTDVTAAADRADELPRIEPVLELATEWSLTSGGAPPTERLERLLAQIGRPVARVGCRALRIVAWAAVAGIDVEVDEALPGPHGAMARRDWRAAADGFGAVGWTYDRALMLSLLDDEAALGEALAIARTLGAEPLALRVASRMRGRAIAAQGP
jgi:hypothetical protein